MAKFEGNASIELYFEVDTDEEENVRQFLVSALRSMSIGNFKVKDFGIHYFGCEEVNPKD